MSRDDKFQKLFEKQIEFAVDAATHLHAVFSDAEKAQAAEDRVLAREHEGDECTRQGHELLSKTFITKLDKSDIEVMFKKLDDILDSMEGVVRRIRSHSVKQFTPHSVQIVGIIMKMTSELQAMVAQIQKLSSQRASEIVGILKALEREADDLRWGCIKALADNVSRAVKSQDALVLGIAQNEQYVWEQLISKLEQTTNHCFHLAVTIVGVVRKEGR
ncbi:MAG: DUF47 family protein [Candidatus Yonathbacteria bacterium]|nr:DUF47 family protein [Candidatus Yonathbacteria bacterium]